MTTDKEIMRDLHVIREQFYEETKHMTPEERVSRVQREVDEGLAKLGMTLNREEPANRRSFKELQTALATGE